MAPTDNILIREGLITQPDQKEAGRGWMAECLRAWGHGGAALARMHALFNSVVLHAP